MSTLINNFKSVWKIYIKKERKSATPWLALAGGTLAAVGAVSIVCHGKSFIKCKMKKIGDFFKGEEKCEGAEG